MQQLFVHHDTDLRYALEGRRPVIPVILIDGDDIPAMFQDNRGVFDQRTIVAAYNPQNHKVFLMFYYEPTELPHGCSDWEEEDDDEDLATITNVFNEHLKAFVSSNDRQGNRFVEVRSKEILDYVTNVMRDLLYTHSKIDLRPYPVRTERFDEDVMVLQVDISAAKAEQAFSKVPMYKDIRLTSLTSYML